MKNCRKLFGMEKVDYSIAAHALVWELFVEVSMMWVNLSYLENCFSQ